MLSIDLLHGFATAALTAESRLQILDSLGLHLSTKVVVATDAAAARDSLALRVVALDLGGALDDAPVDAKAAERRRAVVDSSWGYYDHSS